MGYGHFICEPCSIRMGGEFDPKRGVILCENQISTQKQFNDVLSHELIHAFDHCRAFVEWQDCRHHACAEVGLWINRSKKRRMYHRFNI